MNEDKIIARVRALLAKAERTDNPHEAEVFSAKAAEMIDRHRIDVARLSDDPTRYVYSQFKLEGTRYLRASLMLLSIVATHYGVVTVTPPTGNSKYPTLVGAPADIEATQMLFRSLVIQRDRACVAADIPHGMHTTKFRNSFAYGFSMRTGLRLEALRERQRAAARAEHDTTAIEVFDRGSAVERWIENQWGDKLRDANRNDPSIDPFGAVAGDRAARTADLGQDRIDGTTNRPALGGGS